MNEPENKSCGPECLAKLLKRYARPTIFKYPTCITKSNLEAMVREALILVHVMSKSINAEESVVSAYLGFADSIETLLKADFQDDGPFIKNIN